MNDLDDTSPEHKRPERRQRRSLRIIVEENRMLFGALSGVLQDLARSVMMLRRHEHRRRSAETAIQAKLDTILVHLGLPIPPASEDVPVEVEDTSNGAAHER